MQKIPVYMAISTTVLDNSRFQYYRLNLIIKEEPPLKMDFFSQDEDVEQKIDFTIMHTNDEHSSLLSHRPTEQSYNAEPDEKIGGIARLAALIREKRAERCRDNTILVSGGDFLSGDPFSWLSFAGKAPELKLMQEIGYDIITLGNHDLDYGPRHLADYLEAAGYPRASEQTEIIASNTKIPFGHKLDGKGLKDYAVKAISDDIYIGFFAVLGDQALDLIKNRENVNFEHPLVAAENSVRELRNRGADIIVALSHSGLKEDLELVKHVGEIDIIIGAHCHSVLNTPAVEEDTIITQTGSRLENLGVLDLQYDPAEEEVSLKDKHKKTLYKVDDRIEPDDHIAKKVSAYAEELDDFVSEVYHQNLQLMKTAFTADFSVPHLPKYSETPYGNFITDGMRFACQKILEEKVDFAFQASGLIRQGLYPDKGDEAGGEISFYQLASTGSMGSGWDDRPGYPLVSGLLSGREIWRVIELSVLLSEYMGNPFFLQVSGLKFTYDSRRAILFNIPVVNKPLPTGRAVNSVQRYTGEEIQENNDSADNFEPVPKSDEKMYRIVTDYYLARFIPLVGDRIPFLNVELKNEKGIPFENMKDAVISNPAGEEMKVWEAIFDYAGDQDGELADVYQCAGERINDEKKFSVLAKPVFSFLSVVLLLTAGLILTIYLL